MSGTTAQLLADMTAGWAARQSYREAAERFSQRALRELHAGHRSRARYCAKMALRLQREADYEG